MDNEIQISSNFSHIAKYHYSFDFFFFSFKSASLASRVCTNSYGTSQLPAPVLGHRCPWAGILPILLFTPCRWLAQYARQGAILTFWYYVIKCSMIQLFILMTQFLAPPSICLTPGSRAASTGSASTVVAWRKSSRLRGSRGPWSPGGTSSLGRKVPRRDFSFICGQ